MKRKFLKFAACFGLWLTCFGGLRAPQNQPEQRPTSMALMPIGNSPTKAAAR